MAISKRCGLHKNGIFFSLDKEGNPLFVAMGMDLEGIMLSGISLMEKTHTV